jgi:hypothetical protein
MSLVKYNPSLSPLLGEFRDFFDIFEAFDPMTRPVSNVRGPRVHTDNGILTVVIPKNDETIPVARRIEID